MCVCPLVPNAVEGLLLWVPRGTGVTVRLCEDTLTIGTRGGDLQVTTERTFNYINGNENVLKVRVSTYETRTQGSCRTKRDTDSKLGFRVLALRPDTSG